MTATKHPAKPESPAHFDKNNPREVFGWKIYDWANSAFYTTVVGALFSPYLTRLAQDAVGENGVVLDLGFLGAVTAKSLPSLCVSLSVGAQVFLLPVLGALGDYSDLKKKLMALFCYLAVIANCLLFFIKDGLYLWGGLLFIIAPTYFRPMTKQLLGWLLLGFAGFLILIGNVVISKIVKIVQRRR